MERVPNECLGQPAGGGGLSETGSDPGDSLLETESALDNMSMDGRDNGGGTTPDDETSQKPALRYPQELSTTSTCGTQFLWER